MTVGRTSNTITSKSSTPFNPQRQVAPFQAARKNDFARTAALFGSADEFEFTPDEPEQDGDDTPKKGGEKKHIPLSGVPHPPNMEPPDAQRVDLTEPPSRPTPASNTGEIPLLSPSPSWYTKPKNLIAAMVMAVVVIFGAGFATSIFGGSGSDKKEDDNSLTATPKAKSTPKEETAKKEGDAKRG